MRPSSRPCRRPTTSRASRPKTRWPACPTPKTSRRRRRAARDLDLFHPWASTARRPPRWRCACEAAALRDRQAHHQQRRRRRVGPAVALLQRPHPRFSGRLRQLAPLHVGVTDCRQGRRHAARLPGTARMRHAARPGAARGRWAVMPPSGRCSRLKSRKIATAEVPGAVRVAARPPACWVRLVQAAQRRRPVPQEHLPARFAGQAGVAGAHRHLLEDPFVLRGKGSSPFDDEGVTRQAAPGGRWRACARATS